MQALLYLGTIIFTFLFGTSAQKSGAAAGTDHIQFSGGPEVYF